MIASISGPQSALNFFHNSIILYKMFSSLAKFRKVFCTSFGEKNVRKIVFNFISVLPLGASEWWIISRRGIGSYFWSTLSWSAVTRPCDHMAMWPCACVGVSGTVMRSQCPTPLQIKCSLTLNSTNIHAVSQYRCQCQCLVKMWLVVLRKIGPGCAGAIWHFGITGIFWKINNDCT